MYSLIVFVAVAVAAANAGLIGAPLSAPIGIGAPLAAPIGIGAPLGAPIGIGHPLGAPLATSVVATRTLAAPLGLPIGIGAPLGASIASPLATGVLATRTIAGPAIAAPLATTGLIGARSLIGAPAISTLSAAPLAAW